MTTVVFADLVGSTSLFERLGDETASRFVTQLVGALSQVFEQHNGRVVKLLGMVNGAPTFGDQPKVINGCSDLLVNVFGDAGRHARSAVGMGSLPGNMTVEIEAILQVDG